MAHAVPVRHAAPAIRRAARDDAAALADLIVRAFAPYVGRLDPPPSAVKETPATIAARFADHVALIAESDGAIAGCVFLQRQGDAVYLSRVAVDDAWRGRGIAGALLAAAEDAARAMGAARLTLAVRLALPGNRRLFESFGFAAVAERSHPGYTVTTFLDMAKPLS